MPMSGSNYVAPTWVNNAPPALDATELQAMCNTIQENQSDAAALQAAVQELQSSLGSLKTEIGEKANLYVGSFIGTGVTGSSGTITINVGFVPSLLIILQQNSSYRLFVTNIDTTTGAFGGYNYYGIEIDGVSWGSNISFYFEKGNGSGTQYKVIAL